MTDQLQTLPSVAEEGVRLATAARTPGLSLRLLGGVAVWCHCPSARVPPLARPYGDADFVGRAGDRKRITAFMEEHGYEADKMFNALHGATRLNFYDPGRDRPVDVLLDRFVMAHALDLRDSLSPDGLTISLADLLMTKLQVVNINEKDVRDLLALLVDHGVGDGDIDLPRILDATRNDWGLEHTFHRSLTTLREMASEFGLAPGQVRVASERIDELTRGLTAAPKGAKWKMRARIGERVKWYEEPEEARA
ncbi:MAG: hypothetical protein ACJ780_19535 [Solirubrobacteraceae bacterium]